jgi:2-polyprenyl-6-hydroxyphenyl methylase/3-demethylubiquinone-9 3-methyltransferase
MSMPAFQLRPGDPEPGPCKLCGGVSRLFGVTDFNRNCEEVRGRFLPLSGIAVYYRRCEACGLVYSEAFDDWAPEDFETHIYNAAYGEVDGDYEAIRPANTAKMVVGAFSASAGDLAVLDYGGGNGAFARALVEAGFRDTTTYDAFHPDHRTRPKANFDLITCFETLEHMPDPLAGAADIAGFLKADGMVLFSTLTQPANFAEVGMRWWYIGPRNGHVTLHTKRSLAILWASRGLKVASFSDNLHAAYRTVPAFASHLIKAPGS